MATLSRRVGTGGASIVIPNGKRTISLTSAGMASAGLASLAEGMLKTMILSKLKIVQGLALAGMLTLGVGAVAAYQSSSKVQDVKAKIAEKGPKLDDAVKAAEAYLDLLDKGKYAESWDSMSSGAHKAIARAGWAENVSKVRSPPASSRVGSSSGSI